MSRSRLRHQSTAHSKQRGSPRESRIDPIDGRTDSAARPVALLAGLMIAVACVVVIVHWRALSAGALSFDDDQYLTNNRLVQKPSFSNAGRFITEIFDPSTVKGYYQPLTMISLMLDHAIGGSAENLRPFHRTSLALHVCNTLLVIVFLYVLFGRPWPAAMVGLLFGVHPMTVETIAWVGERKTLLAAFFSLWSLLCYVHYARTASWKSYIICLVMFVAALMSKPTSTPLPVLLLLLDGWPLWRLSRRAILEKIPFFVLVVISAVITMVSQGQIAELTTERAQSNMAMPLTIGHNIFFYPYKMLWPVNLSSVYPFPEPLTLSNQTLLAGVIGTCFLIAALVVSLRWTRAFMVGWLFFFVALSPTLLVFGYSLGIAADKYVYLPCVGFLLIIAWLLGRLIDYVGSPGQAVRRLLAVLGVVVVLSLLEAIATRRYLVCWQDTESLYSHMVARAPGVPTLYPTIGYCLKQRGLYDRAIEAFYTALRLSPNHRFADQTHFHLANVLVEQGKLEDAVTHYRESIRLKNDDADVYNNLGVALVRLGRIDEAINSYKKSLELKSDNVGAINNLGALLDDQGKTDEAIACYEKALRIEPNYDQAYNNLGIIFARQKKLDKAVEHFESAVRINPDNHDAHKNLGLALAEQGRIDGAIYEYRRALEIRPQDAGGHYMLGSLLERQGHIDQAITEYRRVLQIDSRHKKAEERLNAALSKRERP